MRCLRKAGCGNPEPQTARGASASRIQHESLHFGHRPLQAGEQCPRDNSVTDIELAHIQHGRDRLYIAVMQPVTGIDLQTSRDTGSNGIGNAPQLGGLFRESNSITRRQVPLLGDIPVLGALFRSQSTFIKAGWSSSRLPVIAKSRSSPTCSWSQVTSSTARRSRRL